MITQIYHKKNEIQEVESFKDKECTEAFESKSHLYYLHNADCEAILKCVQELEGIFIIPYISKTQMPILSSAIRIERLEHNSNSHFWTLSDTKEYNERHFQTLLPNLSKYIPEDNAVLFLSKDIQTECENSFMPNEIYTYVDNNIEGKSILENVFYYGTRINELQEKITIFLPHGTQSELKKAVEVKKELKEKYGVEEVNLCVLHWFDKNDDYDVISFLLYKKVFNEIITTNSTGILKAKDFRRYLQVIDCKEIFEEYLKENN